MQWLLNWLNRKALTRYTVDGRCALCGTPLLREKPDERFEKTVNLVIVRFTLSGTRRHFKPCDRCEEEKARA